VLREVAVIAAEDTRRTAHLLAHYAITTPTTSLHEHNERQKVPQLVGRLQNGEDVAVVSDAGTPTISDPGQLLIRAAADAGIPIEPVPGANAAIAALSASGFPSDTFAFFGFPPIRSKDRKLWFERLREVGGTVVFYEAPHRIRETLDELLHTIGDHPILICRELTKVHEQLVKGHISEVLETGLIARGEFTVVLDIGQQTNIGRAATPPPDRQLLVEFGQMTAIAGASRRSLIGSLAKRHGLTTKQVYDAIERARDIG
jgi:16S rRNA (cytidine1402-2'-O)-methyltransferase